jgi:hypothetical protein
MVTDAILGWLASFVGWIGSNLGLPDPPAFLTDLPGYVATASQYVAGTGAWFPWALVITIVGIWATVLLVSLSVKVFRIIASFLTLGGGSAA